MLKRIRIKGFKSLKDVEVELKPLTVLFGPNASGKSNFLDALLLLSRLINKTSVYDLFDPPFRGKPLESFTFGPQGIEGLLNKKSTSLTIEADFKLSDGIIKDTLGYFKLNKTYSLEIGTLEETKANQFKKHPRLRYKISIGYKRDTGSILIDDEFLCLLSERYKPDKGEPPIIDVNYHGSENVGSDAIARSHTIVNTFAGIRPFHCGLSMETERWHVLFFEPRIRMRTPTPLSGGRPFYYFGEGLGGLLHYLSNNEKRQFKAIEKGLNVLIPSITKIETFTNKEDGTVDFRLIENGRTMSSRIISDGTLRILGFLTIGSIAPPPTLIAFEEPENGIHPRRIRLMAEYFKNLTYNDIQVVVATHSPTLIEQFPEENLFVCKTEKGYTNIEPFSSFGPLGRKISKKTKVEKALRGKGEPLTISGRILRGDFDDA